MKYVAPDGFRRHKWGDLRTQFRRACPNEPIGVGAAWMNARGKGNRVHVRADNATGPTMGGAVDGCDFQATLSALRKKFEGGGFYVLSEYTIDDQGFRFGDENDGVVLHPVVYQFCANWDETKREVPPKFDEMNKFCGVRLMFQSETREELRRQAGRSRDHLRPRARQAAGEIRQARQDFVRRGQVVIETLEGDSTTQASASSASGAGARRATAACTPVARRASRCRSNPATGVGTVLYSTPLLWEFAYARENNGYKGDRLFKMLHARK